MSERYRHGTCLPVPQRNGARPRPTGSTNPKPGKPGLSIPGEQSDRQQTMGLLDSLTARYPNVACDRLIPGVGLKPFASRRRAVRLRARHPNVASHRLAAGLGLLSLAAQRPDVRLLARHPNVALNGLSVVLSAFQYLSSVQRRLES
jgi:hypothetical protein